jgi:hypothetical protein
VNPKHPAGPPRKPSQVLKRTTYIGRHKTSVSLEDAFWSALKKIAATRKIPLSDLVSTIANERGSPTTCHRQSACLFSITIAAWPNSSARGNDGGAQAPSRPADDARHYARARRATSYCVVPERRLPAYRVDRRVELRCRNGDAVFQQPRGLRQVRQPGKQDRCAAELERAADAGEHDREGVAMMPRWRVDIVRSALSFDLFRGYKARCALCCGRFPRLPVAFGLTGERPRPAEKLPPDARELKRLFCVKRAGGTVPNGRRSCPAGRYLGRPR